MRPMLLEVEGFTCFHKKQVVDFTELDLFAITGATGSGKSSLIDAMIWALFGQVPRMGGRYLDELISHGADRMWVRCTFEQSGTTWRVTRVLYRGRPVEVYLERLIGEDASSDSAWAEEATKARAVKSAIEELLGLHYDAFIQAVVLPQGRFADFLRADPTKRQQLLQRLLRLDIYDRMRARAKEHRKELAIRVEGLERRLEEDYQGTDAEALEQRRAQLAALDAEQRDERAALEALEAELSTLEALEALWKSWDILQRELLSLEDQRRELADKRGRLSRSREVAPFLRRLRDLERLQAECEEARSAVRVAEREEAEVRRELAGLPELAPLEAERAEVMDRRQRLEALLPLLGPLERGRREQARLRGERRRLCDKLGGDVALVPPADPAWLERLRSLEERGRDLSDKLRERAAKAAEHAEAEGRRAAHAERVGAARGRLAAAAEVVGAAREHLISRQAALRALEREHRAAHLRSELVPGGRCPVCLQVVTALPEEPHAGPLGEAQHAVRDAEIALREAEADKQRAEQELALAERDLHHQDARVASLEAGLAALSRDVDGLLESIELGLGEALEPDMICEEIPGWLSRELLLQELAACDVALTACAEELATLEEQLRDAPAASELPAAIEAARRREEALAAQVAELRRRREELEAALEVGVSARTAAVSVLSERERLCAERGAALDRELAEAGYTSRQAIAEQALDEEEIQALEAAIRDFERREISARERRAELEAAIGGRERVEAAAIGRERRRHEDLSASLERRAKEIGHLEFTLAALEEKRETAAKLRAECTAAQQQLAVYLELEQLLRADRFPRSELDSSFQRLVRGASHRLRALSSDRYELAYSDGHFYVVDHNNAGERRRANTLSGGETFSASLALALELSEQVQQSFGAIRLDSLFVDEGFGSLDEDAMDAAAAVIEKLSEGSRMVGVITHVRSMSERLPARLLLEREPGGSSLTVERG